MLSSAVVANCRLLFSYDYGPAANASTDTTYERIVPGESGEAVLAEDGDDPLKLQDLNSRTFTVCDEDLWYYTLNLDDVNREGCNSTVLTFQH